MIKGEGCGGEIRCVVRVRLYKARQQPTTKGVKNNESFKSNHDRGRFGQRLEPGCLRAKEIVDDHDRNHGSVDAYLLKISFHLRIALT